jgi:GH43 family beta-xylosidase
MTPTISTHLSSVELPAIAEVPSFQNPIAPGADPWVIRHGEWYYWCLSENMLGVGIYRSRTLTELGERIVHWHAPRVGSYCAEIWAPELHRIDDRWYVYVAASDGNNENHRMIVLEAEGELESAEFEIKGELYTGDDVATGRNNRWAIDATPVEFQGQRYVIWSGWEDHRDIQHLYIAKLLNPWTVGSNRVRLCANDDFIWERVDETAASRGLNEAPQVLSRDGRLFVVYSASASWQTTYKLGLLELMPDSDPLQTSSWKKHAQPVLHSSARTWGVGHCSFTTSPDGSEDWIAFHAKLEQAPNWDRAIHVQPFSWTASGLPNFGRAFEPGEPLNVPAGQANVESRVAMMA